MILNVRCCCQPSKVLGTLEVPDDIGGLYHNSTVYVLVDDKPEQVKFKEFIYGRLGGTELAELAIYSDDRPIEFWKKILGFKEGEEVNVSHRPEADLH